MKLTLGCLFTFMVMMSCKNENKTSMVLEETQEAPKTVFAENVRVINEKRVITVSGELLAKEKIYKAMVSATDIIHIQKGDEAIIDFPSQSEIKLVGEVINIYPKPGTDEVEVNISITLENQEIPEDLPANIVITTQETLPLISIPIEAIVSEADHIAKVYLFEDGNSILKEVVVYKKEPKRILISSGLVKGDQVVMVSNDYVQHDETVLNK